MNHTCDVAIIGAGPAGACAAALLARQGIDVHIYERQHFPRFSIGESLLPQSMSFMEQAGLLDDVVAHGFQRKNGALFLHNSQFSCFEFAEKFTQGPYETFQVQRGSFDKILADGAQKQGANIHYAHQLNAIEHHDEFNRLTIENIDTNASYQVDAKFVLDASGFGRVLPKLCDMETPSDFPVRQAIFTHIDDGIDDNFDNSFDREKILITVHPDFEDIWFWLIPFSNGTSSLGVVGKTDQFEQFKHLSLDEQLMAMVNGVPKLSELLANSQPKHEARIITGYSANVKQLYGPRFALLGNAGEFLDPVFSSGVTIALQSATMAAPLVQKVLASEPVDWQQQFSEPLRQGINTFKTFVEGWYNGDLRKVIFYPKPDPHVKRMICSILAGYAWDLENPMVKNPKRGLRALAGLCD